MTYAPAVITHRMASRSRLAAVALVVAAAALTALAAQVRIPLWPVPITGQTFAVLLTGAALGWRAGAAAQLLYLALGAAGLPVFSPDPESVRGLEVLVGPTAGYLFAFPVAAAVVGRLAELRQDRRFWTMLVAFVIGSAIIYLGGMIGLVIVLDLSVAEAFSVGLAPFLVGDAVKAVAAGVVLPGAWRLVRRHT